MAYCETVRPTLSFALIERLWTVYFLCHSAPTVAGVFPSLPEVLQDMNVTWLLCDLLQATEAFSGHRRGSVYTCGTRHDQIRLGRGQVCRKTAGNELLTSCYWYCSLLTASDNCFVSKVGFNAGIEYTFPHSALVRFGDLLNVNTYSTLRKGKYYTVQLDIRCTPSLCLHIRVVYSEMLLTDLIATGATLTVNVLCKSFFRSYPCKKP